MRNDVYGVVRLATERCIPCGMRIVPHNPCSVCVVICGSHVCFASVGEQVGQCQWLQAVARYSILVMCATLFGCKPIGQPLPLFAGIASSIPFPTGKGN